MQPKTVNIIYWITTVLFTGFMIWSSIPGVMQDPQSMGFMHDILGYPAYFVVFISVAKIVGSLAVLLPLPKTLKEWAYAGLFFDLIGAIVSVTVAMKGFNPGILFILLPAIIGALSYIFWHKKQ